MSNYRLSNVAKEDLIRIHQFGLARFGCNQADSYHDVAKILSELSGKSVTYTDIEASVFTEQLKQIGVPEIGIFIATGFSTDIKNEQYEIVTNDLEKLLGRKPTNLKDSLKEIYKL